MPINTTSNITINNSNQTIDKQNRSFEEFVKNIKIGDNNKSAADCALAAFVSGTVAGAITKNPAFILGSIPFSYGLCKYTSTE